MKRLLIIAAATALLLPSLSLAQPGRPDHGNNRPDKPGDRPGGNGGPGGRPDRPVTLPAPVPDRPNPGGPNRPGPGAGPGPNRPGPGPGMRPPPSRPGVGVRPPSRPQFSWRGRQFNPIRGSAFRYPPGYNYRRWSVGAFLPSLFLSSFYYYNDWRTVGIDPPPPGRRWVRYGSDLLLVNQRTRRVEDVIYNVFY